MEDIWAALQIVQPAGARQDALYGEALARFNDFSDARSRRLHCSLLRLPPSLWGLLLTNGFLVVGSIIAAIVGYSLLTRRAWGRVLAIVAAVLVLFKPILGTALGIYTLWVLAPSVSGMEYDSIAEPD